MHKTVFENLIDLLQDKRKLETCKTVSLLLYLIKRVLYKIGF